MKKIVKLLAIMGALFNTPAAPAEEPVQTTSVARATVNLAVNGEARRKDFAEAEVLLSPKFAVPVGDANAVYQATFRKLTNDEGKTDDWQTYAHKLSVVGENCTAIVGRHGLRALAGANTTIGFDNLVAGKVGRTFTGAFLEYKPWHATFGTVAKDGVIDPAHWDMLLGSWSHRFDDVLAVQLHAAVSKDHVENTGIAVEWTPSERITILADCIKKPDQNLGMLVANYRATPSLKWFLGAEITDPTHNQATARIVTGATKKICKGMEVYGCAERLLGATTETRVGLGFRCQKTF